MTTRRPFQFSIAMLLALTGVVAVIIWALVSERTAITTAILAVLVPAFPCLAITGCVNTEGYGKAFWIGAAGASIVAALPLIVHLVPIHEYRSKLAFWWGAMIPVGLLCVAFRWLLVRGAEKDASV